MYKESIAIYSRKFIPGSIESLKKIIKKIEDEGYKVLIYKEIFDTLIPKVHFSENPYSFSCKKDLIYHNTKMLFSIGGDGSILDSVRIVADSNIPVLGFNFGRMGFLSMVKKDKIDEILDELFTGKYDIEERTLVNIQTQDNVFKENNYGLNEVSFQRNGPNSMLSVKVWVDGLYLNKYWGDGLIIATPTGSTAYSLSCGGPILVPEVKSFVLSPISSHNLTVGSIVIPEDSIIKLVVECREENFSVNIDSVSACYKSGTEFTISKNKFNFNLIRPNGINFFNTIREKLNWGIDIRN